ncbi:MAG: RtcB family protein [Pseudomonadota bacterium]
MNQDQSGSARGETYRTAGGHAVRLLTALHEPELQLTKALNDLDASLPSADALAAVGADCAIEDVTTTPDFHAGKPMPVGVITQTRGFLMPHAIGNDIGCGMRSFVLPDVSEADITSRLPPLKRALRHVFFQGGRALALTGRQRRAILREGLIGFAETLNGNRTGLLSHYDRDQAERDLGHTCDLGAFLTDEIAPEFEDYCKGDDDLRNDAILGSIGGGNHFVELQTVDSLADGSAAHAFGLAKGQIIATVHSGSLGFGQNVGVTVRDRLRAAWANQPGADHRILACNGPSGSIIEPYWRGLSNATNAAFANRLFLGLGVAKALAEVLSRPVAHRLVYDAPHNVIWRDGDRFLHRKGACPARGPVVMAGSAFAHVGEPVILPGSMGDATWILAGRGADRTLSSSAHGAGRRLTRQDARREPFARHDLHVVLPVDLDNPELKRRRDIVADLRGRLAEEAPNAYRPIESVVDAMAAADVVGPVAKLRPLITVKG